MKRLFAVLVLLLVCAACSTPTERAIPGEQVDRVYFRDLKTGKCIVIGAEIPATMVDESSCKPLIIQQQ
jgi:uncharacterized protein YcfL